MDVILSSRFVIDFSALAICDLHLWALLWEQALSVFALLSSSRCWYARESKANYERLSDSNAADPHHCSDSSMPEQVLMWVNYARLGPNDKLEVSW